MIAAWIDVTPCRNRRVFLSQGRDKEIVVVEQSKLRHFGFEVLVYRQ